MKNTEALEAVILDPKEYGIEETNALSIEEAFKPQIILGQELSKVFKEVISKELTPELSVEAKTLKNKLVKVRTGIAAVHKSQKEYFLSAGRYVDAWKNKETLPITQMEEQLEEIENHFANLERQKIVDLHNSRIAELTPYVDDFTGLDLGNMQDEVWQGFFDLKKKQHNEKIKAERLAELERLAEIEKENERKRLQEIENERVRKENEALKKEAEKKEKALEKERTEAKEKADKIEAELQKERKAAQDKIDAERKENERLAKELQDKKDAEIKAENERIEAEKLQQKETAKLAKAPIKKQMKLWVNSFELPKLEVENETKADIILKFEAFKKWAETQIENL